MDPVVKEQLDALQLEESKLHAVVFKTLLDVGCGKKSTTHGKTEIMNQVEIFLQHLMDQGWLEIPKKE